jgi:hypothetical protein
MEKTFTFTVEQIKQIYAAGIRRGNDESLAYEWGQRPDSGEFDWLHDAIHGIVNDGKQYDNENYADYSKIEEWFK